MKVTRDNYFFNFYYEDSCCYITISYINKDTFDVVLPKKFIFDMSIENLVIAYIEHNLKFSYKGILKIKEIVDFVE